MIPSILPQHKEQIYTSEMMFNESIPFDCVRGFIHTKKEEFTIGMHEHNFYEINIIKNGKGFHYIRNKRMTAKKGDVFIIPPKVTHGYYTENPASFEIIHILIHSFYINKFKDELRSLNGFRVLFEIEPNIRFNSSEKLFLRLTPNQLKELTPLINILTNPIVKDAHDAIDRMGILTSFISSLSKIYMYNNKIREVQSKKLNSTYIIETMNYMMNNFKEKIEITELAKIAKMSVSTYQRHFKKITNSTPIEYLTSIRLREGKYLLSHTDLTIVEIAIECGFYDSSHFVRFFKEKYNCTPLMYKKDHKHNLTANY